jgi:TusA-related sulfurtransferase
MQHSIDITKEHCPMTMVKVKLKLAAIAAGDTLDVLLQGDEPLNNIPRTAQEQGFSVLSVTPEGERHHVLIRK